jgi:hypothetical protein
MKALQITLLSLSFSLSSFSHLISFHLHIHPFPFLMSFLFLKNISQDGMEGGKLVDVHTAISSGFPPCLLIWSPARAFL